MNTVFTYGTLQLQEVMQAVTGRAFDSDPATLHGFARSCIRNEVFPGIFPQPGHQVCGTIYHEVDPPAMVLLDAFEDVLYERKSLPVYWQGNNTVQAEVYVVSASYRHLLTGRDWELTRFREMHLAAYLRSCKRFYQSFNKGHWSG